MGIRLVKLTNSAVEINDLGITISGVIGTVYDLTDEQANDIFLSASGGDLEAAINGTAPFTVPELVVEDPRDGAVGNLNAVDSLRALQAANDVHFGIRGAVISDLDDVTGTPGPNDVLQFSGGSFQPVTPSVLASDIALGDLSDVDDASAKTNGVPYIFKGDGTNLDVVDFTADADVIEAVEDIIGGAFQNGTDTTFVYNDGAGTMQVDVDDVFLRNTGDTLDSGTLNVASGASITVSSGADLTIVDAPVNPTDATNKEYVDSVASGLDPKESVRGATVSDIGGTYSAVGGTGGTGSFTGVDLTSDAIFDGVPTAVGGFQVGDRILVKDQTDNLQNGIYVVTTAGAAGAIERAPDQDGSPASEVSGGNYTFVENGTQWAATGWVVQGDGVLTLNTDPIVWVQFSESSSFTAGPGLALTGSEFSLDIDNLTAATIATTDEIAFNDVSDSNTTRNTTVADFLSDLNVVNGVTTDGLIINNAGTYSTVSIAVDGTGALDGLVVANADGTAGNPTLGLDINNLPVRSDAVDGNDRLAVYNITSGANEYYTVSEIANAGAANAFGVIVGDTGTATADSPSDTVNFTGDGVVVTATAGAAAAVSFDLSVADLTAGAGTVDLTDELVVGESANTVRYSFQDVVDDLGIVNGVAGGTGILVGDGAGNYSNVSIAVEGAGAEAGLTIDNADGVAGNPTLGHDITGQAAAGENLTAADEVLVYNDSATANQKMTGQEIADGVSDILGLPSGLAVTTIGGQEVLTLVDTTRSNKVLSVETTAITWSENRIGNNDWVQIGGAVDAESGYIVPLDATIVKVTAHTSDDNNNVKDIDLYIDGALNTAGFISFNPAVNGQNEYSSVTDNIDVAAGEKIRLRGAATGGPVDDTVITIWLKWRG
jgi:hypothetical protein